jgi:effector-binding domain-containing protein
MSTENMEALGKQMGASYGELMGALTKAKIEMIAAPFCIYNKWDEAAKQTDFVCALQVPEDAKLPAKYAVMKTSGGLAVKAISLGSYDNLANTHGEIEKYIAFKNLEIVGAPWEVYVTDPEMEKDTTKWITEVYYPVKKK